MTVWRTPQRVRREVQIDAWPSRVEQRQWLRWSNTRFQTIPIRAPEHCDNEGCDRQVDCQQLCKEGCCWLTTLEPLNIFRARSVLSRLRPTYQYHSKNLDTPYSVPWYLPRYKDGILFHASTLAAPALHPQPISLSNSRAFMSAFREGAVEVRPSCIAMWKAPVLR